MMDIKIEPVDVITDSKEIKIFQYKSGYEDVSSNVQNNILYPHKDVKGSYLVNQIGPPDVKIKQEPDCFHEELQYAENRFKNPPDLKFERASSEECSLTKGNIGEEIEIKYDPDSQWPSADENNFTNTVRLKEEQSNDFSAEHSRAITAAPISKSRTNKGKSLIGSKKVRVSYNDEPNVPTYNYEPMNIDRSVFQQTEEPREPYSSSRVDSLNTCNSLDGETVSSTDSQANNNPDINNLLPDSQELYHLLSPEIEIIEGAHNVACDNGDSYISRGVHTANTTVVLDSSKIRDARLLSAIGNGGEVENVPLENYNANKRKRGEKNILNWKSSQRKLNRNLGNEYISDKKAKNCVREKKFKFVECKCSHACSKNILLEERKNIHELFWRIDSWDLKTSFILQNVSESKNKSSKKGSNRLKCRSFKLNNKSCCKKVFMATLDLSSSRINYAIKNKIQDGVQVEDKRGKKEPSNKTLSVDVDNVKASINALPRYASHYSSSEKKKYYLHPELTIGKMHALYKEWMQTNYPEANVVSPYVYRQIFNDFNPHFYISPEDSSSQ